MVALRFAVSKVGKRRTWGKTKKTKLFGVQKREGARAGQIDEGSIAQRTICFMAKLRKEHVHGLQMATKIRQESSPKKLKTENTTGNSERGRERERQRDGWSVQGPEYGQGKSRSRER